MCYGIYRYERGVQPNDTALEGRMVELRDFAGLAERLVVDTSEEQPAYLLIGKSGRYLRLSPNVYAILRGIYDGLSFDALAEQLSQTQNRSITCDEVEAAYQHIIARLRSIEQEPVRDQLNFWFRLPLISAQLVAWLARPLTWAFHPWVALSGIGVIIIVALLLPWHTPALHSVPTNAGIAYVLFLISLMVHEFGHASACARYGASPGTIGFTIYWIYPAFYSDVSAAWQLKRWQRVVVDLGGIFLQLLVAVGYALFYMASGWEPAYLAILTIIYSVIFSLNPIFKFDGYWVLSDALGVTNLSQQRARIFRYLAARLRRQPITALPWPPWIVAFVSIYSVVSTVFWVYMIVRLLPFAGQALMTYPALMGQFINELLVARQQIAWQHVQSFLFSTFFTFLMLLMLGRMLRMLLLPLINWARRLVLKQATPTP